MHLLLLLLLARTAALPLPTFSGFCDDASRASWPICDATLSLDVRSQDLLSRLTLADKVSLTSTDASASSIALPHWNWWNEGTHGVWNNVGPPWPCETLPCDGPVTVFALPITTSCAFNRSMWLATGNQIGRESRALWNSKGDVRGGTYWTPVVVRGALARAISHRTGSFLTPAFQLLPFNRTLCGIRDGVRKRGIAHTSAPAPSTSLARAHPAPSPPCPPRALAGRNLECPGEDPLLSGIYATHFVQGLQTAKEAPYPLQASACC
jgi:hypothetical protein